MNIQSAIPFSNMSHTINFVKSTPPLNDFSQIISASAYYNIIK